MIDIELECFHKSTIFFPGIIFFSGHLLSSSRLSLNNRVAKLCNHALGHCVSFSNNSGNAGIS